MKTLYYCDPEKNIACRKTCCAYLLTPEEGGICAVTFIPEHARTDSDGNPIEYKGKINIRKVAEQRCIGI